MSPKRNPRTNKTSGIVRVLIIAGYVLILSGLSVAAGVMAPIVFQELRYDYVKTAHKVPTNTQKIVRPIDAQFGIVIPKIGANAKIIPNVNPYDSRIYQQALTKGVAHAKGSAFPGRAGNVFIFSHSSATVLESIRYNSVFYLVDKLELGDEVLLYFNNQKFTYRVIEKTHVAPSEISYLTEKTDKKLLTLMTCWPPGTTFERLIIRAILQES